jgi:hypothetical protein
MNPEKRDTLVCYAVLFIALSFCMASTTPALGSPVIHVDWGLPGDPTPGWDYEIDTSDPNYPDIDLITGDTTWRVWSRDSVTGAISDIGDITAFGFANYTLVLTDNYGNPGARHVLSIVLTPGGSHDSGIDPYDAFTPSAITGNLSGDVTLLDEGPEIGGYCSIEVGGDVSGTWSAPGPVNVEIDGSVTSSASLSFGIIYPDREVIIVGNVDGPIFLLGGMAGALPDRFAAFIVGGHLNANVTIGLMGDCVQVGIGGDCNASIVTNYGCTPGSVLGLGPNSEIQIFGALGSQGVIDFNLQELQGLVKVWDGGSGTIEGVAGFFDFALIEVGTLTGDVFSGAIQVQPSGFFDSPSGTISATNLGSGADICAVKSGGTIAVSGDFASGATIEVPGGEIVEGDLSGTIFVGGSGGGEIRIEDSLGSEALVQFDNGLGGTIIIDEDADEEGTWLGNVYVFGNELVTPGCYW